MSDDTTYAIELVVFGLLAIFALVGIALRLVERSQESQKQEKP